MATLKNTTVNDTSFLTLPSGTVAQRPGSPVQGMARFNNQINEVEVYNGTAWYSNSNPVQTSLLVYLDANYTASYPGTGSTWFDLSGNGNNFTLYNSPTYIKGAIGFNGSNQYAASVNNINLSSYNSITVETWFRANNTSDGMILEHTTNWNTQTGGWGLYINSTGSTNQANMMHTNHNSEGARNYAFTIDTNWNCQTNIFSIISDSTGRLSYGNGNLLSFDSGAGYPTNTITTAGGSFPNAILYLGSRAGTGGFLNGSISVIKIYGTKLTAAQITQNFYALNGRYGI